MTETRTVHGSVVDLAKDEMAILHVGGLEIPVPKDTPSTVEITYSTTDGFSAKLVEEKPEVSEPLFIRGEMVTPVRHSQYRLREAAVEDSRALNKIYRQASSFSYKSRGKSRSSGHQHGTLVLTIPVCLRKAAEYESVEVEAKLHPREVQPTAA